MFNVGEVMFIKVFFVVMLATTGCAQTVAEGYRHCRNNQPEILNTCLKREFLRIRPMLAAGIPELGLPPLDPARLGGFHFRQSQPPVTIDAEFGNVVVTGTSTYDVKYLEMNWETRKYSQGLTIPVMTARGKYRVKGKVFELPIEGQGNFIMRLDGVIIEIEGILVQRGNNVTMEKIKVGFQVRDIKTKMDKLFPNNKVMSDTIHHFLNENGQLLINEIRPGISKQMIELIGGLMNTSLAALPLDTVVYIPNTNIKDPSVGNRDVGDTTGLRRIV